MSDTITPKCKYVVIGDTGVGKTSITKRYTKDEFSNEREITIGVDFLTVVDKETIPGKNICIKIWDTAGSCRFRSLARTFLRYAKGILLVYDVTNKESFYNIQTWLTEIRDNSEYVNIILVGNKIENTKKRQVTFEEGQSLAQREGMSFIETSAKSGINIKEAFSMLTKDIYRENPDAFELRDYNNNVLDICYGKRKKEDYRCGYCILN